MVKRSSSACVRATLALTLALAAAMASATNPPSVRADTGGDTELTVQRVDDEDGRSERPDDKEAKEDRPDDDDAQKSGPEGGHAGDNASGTSDSQSKTTARGQGGGTPQTGDITPAAPVLFVVAGAGLVLGGRVFGRYRDASLPVIVRGDAADEPQGREA